MRSKKTLNLFSKPHLILFFAVALTSALFFQQAHGNTNHLIDYRCESLYEYNNAIFKNCQQSPTDYFSSLVWERGSSKLTVHSDNHNIPLRKKIPLATGKNTANTHFYIDDRLFLDTGASHSLFFSKKPISPTHQETFVSTIGIKKTFDIEEKHLSTPYFSIGNIKNIKLEDANKYLVYAKFSGYLGLDFFIALKTVCLDIYNSRIISSCFRKPDTIGRILISNNKKLYLPIAFKNKKMYALFDSGFSDTRYLSRDCPKEEESAVADAFGNRYISKGKSLVQDITINETTIKEVSIFCQHHKSVNATFILGADFISNHINYIDFNFEDNTFSLDVR